MRSHWLKKSATSIWEGAMQKSYVAITFLAAFLFAMPAHAERLLLECYKNNRTTGQTFIYTTRTPDHNKEVTIFGKAYYMTPHWYRHYFHQYCSGGGYVKTTAGKNIAKW